MDRKTDRLSPEVCLRRGCKTRKAFLTNARCASAEPTIPSLMCSLTRSILSVGLLSLASTMTNAQTVSIPSDVSCPGCSIYGDKGRGC